MDPIERVRAALSLDVADRPPVGWWGHTFREEWSARALADVTIARLRTYGWDFAKLQPRACCFAEALGCAYRPSGDPREGPVLVRPAIAEPEDWRALPPVDASAPALADQVEALRLVVEELGPDVPVIQTVFSPLTVAGYLAGPDRERTVADLVRDREALGGALGRIAGALASFAAASVDAGAAGVFFAISAHAAPEAVSLERYRELVLPHDRTVLDAVAGRTWFDVLHLCGPRIRPELAADLPTHAISWSIHDRGNPGLAEVREATGRAVMGGIDQVGTLVRGTPDDVAAEVRRAVEDTGGLGLLVAPGCSVPVEAPEADLRAVVAPEP